MDVMQLRLKYDQESMSDNDMISIVMEEIAYEKIR